MRNKNFWSVIASAVLAVVIILFVFYEVEQGKQDLLKIVDEESKTLIHSLTASIEKTIYSNMEFEELLLEKMNSVAEIASLSCDKLDDISHNYSVSDIIIADFKGNIICSLPESDTKKLPADFFAELENYHRESFEWVELGVILNPLAETECYSILRIIEEKYYVIIGIDSKNLLDYRLKIGIGKKIQDIASNPSIIYAVLQDSLGILTASKNIEELEPIVSDPFLLEAYQSGKTMSRIKDFHDSKIYEIVELVQFNDSKILNRLALSLENIRDIQQGAMRRAIFIGIGIFMMGVLIIVFLRIKDKLIKLKTEHNTAQNYTRLILNSMTDAVIAVNEGSKILVFNKAAEQIFERPEIEALGKDYKDVFPADELMLGGQLLRKEALIYKETEYRSSTGKNLTLALNISFVFDNTQINNPHITTGIVLVRDLTKRRELEESLHRKDKLAAMGELAGGVAHEIRNPLNAIAVIAQRFELEFEVPDSDKEEYMKLVKTVRREADRVNSIITQFLQFAKPLDLNISKGKISVLISNTLNVTESQALQRNIKINKIVPEDFEYELDHEKMLQVMINLVQNAIESLNSGGLIEISAYKNEERLHITVSDTGCGIEKDTLGKIFNPYFTTKKTGTGLGLSIVHQIVTGHGGEISADSAIDKGTVFRIII